MSTDSAHSQPQIAFILHVGLGTANRDIQILKQQAKKYIAEYIVDTLPLAYPKCLIELEAIVKRTWDITNSSQTSSIQPDSHSFDIDSNDLGCEGENT
jgi:hypothetical protein